MVTKENIEKSDTLLKYGMIFASILAWFIPICPRNESKRKRLHKFFRVFSSLLHFVRMVLIAGKNIKNLPKVVKKSCNAIDCHFVRFEIMTKQASRFNNASFRKKWFFPIFLFQFSTIKKH
jgi:hypothetical protein